MYDTCKDVVPMIQIGESVWGLLCVMILIHVSYVIIVLFVVNGLLVSTLDICESTSVRIKAHLSDNLNKSLYLFFLGF